MLRDEQVMILAWLSTLGRSRCMHNALQTNKENTPDDSQPSRQHTNSNITYSIYPVASGDSTNGFVESYKHKRGIDKQMA